MALTLAGLAALAGCGGSDGADASTSSGSDPETGEAADRPADFVGIRAVETHDERSLTVLSDPVPDGAVGTDCHAELDPQATEAPGHIAVTVYVETSRPQWDLEADPATREPWGGCPVAERTVTVPLGEPVGERSVQDPMGAVFRLEGGDWVGCADVVMTCITEPASCDGSTLRDSIANADVPRHFGMGEKRCEEPYAVVDVDVGAGACPATGEPGPNPCAGQQVHRQYWQIEDEAWTLIARDDSAGCGSIHDHAPDFPDHLCADLPAVG